MNKNTSWPMSKFKGICQGCQRFETSVFFSEKNNISTTGCPFMMTWTITWKRWGSCLRMKRVQSDLGSFKGNCDVPVIMQTKTSETIWVNFSQNNCFKYIC